MKKIKRARQLAAKKQQLKEREAKLALQIVADWKAVKQSFRPSQLLKTILKQVS